MTITGRIRLFLVAVALLPPLIVTAVIYFQSLSRLESSRLSELRSRLEEASTVVDTIRGDCRTAILQLAWSDEMKRAGAELKRYSEVRTGLDLRPYDLDFLELADAEGKIVYSVNRPGLIGRSLPSTVDFEDTTESFRLEIDFRGEHPSIVMTLPIDIRTRLYSGQFLDSRRLQHLYAVLNGPTELVTDDSALEVLSQLQPFELYREDNAYRACLLRSDDHLFALEIIWPEASGRAGLLALLKVTLVVALISGLGALALGFLITGRVKREIENLVRATSKIARGNFEEPVMAYEEGEFSQLADAFTDMTLNLRRTQRELATSEKIAAWQVIGRKIAHEIKNPLSPIAISADDLRRSYRERLDGFDQILEDTTTTIKSEVTRLSALLDEFVGFARMRPPQKRPTDLRMLVDSIENLYSREIAAKRIDIRFLSRLSKVEIDGDAIKQLMINLIKNALEATEEGAVCVIVNNTDNSLVITVEDEGPGFSEEKLENSFEPFSSTKPGGSGLGLVICYRIARDHDGRLELYNRETGGAGVRLTIPANL